MSLISSFTLRPYSSCTTSSSSCGGVGHDSAFEAYRAIPSNTSGDNCATNAQHEFIPIPCGVHIEAGTMLQDRLKRPASYRFELGSDGSRPLSHSVPSPTLEGPLEDDTSQLLVPPVVSTRTFYKSAESNTEMEYKALYLSCEIRIHEQKGQISRLHEEKRKLRLKIIELQAQLLETQQSQSTSQQNIPTATVIGTHHESVFVNKKDDVNKQDSHSEANAFIGNQDPQHGKCTPPEKDTMIPATIDIPPVNVVTFLQSPELGPNKPTCTVSENKENIKQKSSKTRQGRVDKLVSSNNITKRRKFPFKEMPETNAEHANEVRATRQSTRRRRGDALELSTPPDSPPVLDGIELAMAESVVRSVQKQQQHTSGENSPIDILHQSCASLSPIPLEVTSTKGVVPLHDAAIANDTLRSDKPAATATSSIESRPKRIRKGLISNTFQAPALKKKQRKFSK